jgi:hypothetical protein
MYSPHQTPEPIEKIRKAQWTVENTRHTQAVVDRLIMSRIALKAVGNEKSEVSAAISAAIARFQELDPKVKT